jgi:general secretion pathway protein K
MSGARQQQRGMALISVLMLVAVMGVLTAAALETINHSLRITGNARSSMQARYFALGAEQLAIRRLESLVAASGNRVTLAGGWNGARYQLPTDVGTLSARVADGGNCFNLNSLVDGADAISLRRRARGVEQFVALAIALGAPQADARRAADGIVDWIDADSVPSPLGGEDAQYARGKTAYLPANTLLAEASELRAIAGVGPGLYELLRPWVCTLPTTEMSPINVNTLSPAEAPLVAMLLPGRLTIDAARQVLAARPAGGWESMLDFWRNPAFANVQPSSAELEQPKLTTRYFSVETQVSGDGFDARQSALLDIVPGRSRVVARRWTTEE